MSEAERQLATDGGREAEKTQHPSHGDIQPQGVADASKPEAHGHFGSGSTLDGHFADQCAGANGSSSGSGSRASSALSQGLDALLAEQEALQPLATESLHAKADAARGLGRGDAAINELERQLHKVQRAMLKDLVLQKGELSKENMRLKMRLQVTNDRGERAQGEVEAMRRNIKTMVELSRQLAGHAAKEKNSHQNEATTSLRGDLERHLRESLQANRDLAAELSGLRQKLMDQETAYQQEADELKVVLDMANFAMKPGGERGEAAKGVPCAGTGLNSSGCNSPRLQSKPAAAAKEDGGKLDQDRKPSARKWESEDSVVSMVMKENGQVKKRIVALQDLVEQLKLLARDQEKHIADTEGNCEARLQRLTEELAESRKNQARAQEELLALKRAPLTQEGLMSLPGSSCDSRRCSKESERSEQSAMAEDPIGREAVWLSEGKLQDIKSTPSSLASDATRHELLGGQPRSKHDETELLRSRLKRVEEEKNLLTNSFEWKEVAWTTQIENMEREVEDLKRKHHSELQMWLAKDQQPEVPARAASGSHSPTSSVQVDCPAVPAPKPLSMLGMLRCKARKAAGPQDLGPQPEFCQDTCWKVLAALKGTVAFWCDPRDHTIVEASREAARMWGSAALQGKAMHELANRAPGATWLKEALEGRDVPEAEGRAGAGPASCVLQELGSESFSVREGEPTDYSVIAVDFPSEPALGRPHMLMVILEPEESAGKPPRWSSGSTGLPSMLYHSAAWSTNRSDRQRSEVSASSVNAEDSASNVHG